MDALLRIFGTIRALRDIAIARGDHWSTVRLTYRLDHFDWTVWSA